MTSIGSSGSGALLNIYVIKSLLFERVIRPGRNVYGVIISQGRGRRATIGTYPSCLALIRPANAAAQLAYAQAGRKEQGPPNHSAPPSLLQIHSPPKAAEHASHSRNG